MTTTGSVNAKEEAIATSLDQCGEEEHERCKSMASVIPKRGHSKHHDDLGSVIASLVCVARLVKSWTVPSQCARPPCRIPLVHWALVGTVEILVECH